MSATQIAILKSRGIVVSEMVLLSLWRTIHNFYVIR